MEYKTILSLPGDDENDFVYEFEETDQLVAFVEIEVEFLRKLVQISSGNRDLHDRVTNVHENCEDALNSLRNLPDELVSAEDTVKSAVSNINSQFHRVFLHSRSINGIVAISLRDHLTPEEACKALDYLAKSTGLRAKFNGVNLSPGPITAIALSGVANLNAKATALIAEGVRDSTSRASAAILSANKASQSAEQVKVRLETLERQFVAIREMKEPQEYWVKKRDSHRKSAWCYFVLMLSTAVGTCSLVVCNAFNAKSDYMKFLNEHHSETPASPWTWIPFSFPVLVIAVVCFWILRILSRLFLTQRHLLADAEERVVLIQTYLALLVGSGVLNKESGIDEKDRHIVLAQLFRHETTGFYDDPSDSSGSMGLTSLFNLKT